MINKLNLINNMKIQNVSYTSYSLYKSCPYCWYLQYKVKLIQPETPALKIGSMYHKGLELLYKEELKGNKDPLNVVLEHIKKEIIVDKTDEEIDQFGLIRKMVELFHANYNSQVTDMGKTIGSEWFFNMKMQDCPLMLTGFIDRITEKGIVEYKTTSQDYKQEEADGLQSLFYNYPYKKQYGRTPQIIYHVTNKKKVRDSSYKPQVLRVQKPETAIQELEDMISEFHDNVEHDRFDPAPKQNHPFWTPYKKYCLAFKR